MEQGYIILLDGEFAKKSLSAKGYVSEMPDERRGGTLLEEKFEGF
jgi:hypothetical protein